MVIVAMKSGSELVQVIQLRKLDKVCAMLLAQLLVTSLLSILRQVDDDDRQLQYRSKGQSKENHKINIKTTSNCNTHQIHH